MAAPTTLDLFCGAGGLSRGFVDAGFQPVLAIDSNRAAVATYARNIGEHVLCANVAPGAQLPTATVIVGGPPCQGFSTAGLRKLGDERNTLVSVFAEIIARERPWAFVFENVEGFLTAESGSRVFELLGPVIRAGYRVHLRKVNAANYGAPQHRKRVVAIGGLGWTPTFPEPTHSAHGAPGAELAGRHLPSTPSLCQALHSLPTPSTSEPGNPSGHFYKPLQGKDLNRAALLQPGQTMRDLPEQLWHDSYRRRAFRRVMDGTPTERRGGAPAGLRRLCPERPSKAITGGATSEFLHPTEDRYLTLRECARIQTFPDTFEFCGTASEQAQLIGNAVPPLLAYSVARALAGDFESQRASSDEPGGLVSFLPTLSIGMSPALRRTADSIRRAFSGDGSRQMEFFA